MSSSYQLAIMSLQSLEESYHEVCHNYLSYSAISAIVSEKGSKSTVPNINMMLKIGVLTIIFNSQNKPSGELFLAA